MPDFHYDELTTIRRKGRLDQVGYAGCDRSCGKGGEFGKWKDADGTFHMDLHYGDRRSRQIAKRHWLENVDNFWSSGGGYRNNVSVKTTTRQKEVFLRRSEW